MGKENLPDAGSFNISIEIFVVAFKSRDSVSLAFLPPVNSFCGQFAHSYQLMDIQLDSN